MNGAAFDFEQIDTEAAKRFECRKESAGPMSQAKRKRHFAHAGKSCILQLTHAKLSHDVRYARGCGTR